MATKFQVTLPDDLADELKQAAEARGVPLAEWIRVTMKLELRRAAARADAILYGE